MGLPDIDHQELNAIAVIGIQLFQGTNLVPKRRSRVGPEDDRDRSIAPEAAKSNLPLAVDRLKFEIQGDVTLFEFIRRPLLRSSSPFLSHGLTESWHHDSSQDDEQKNRFDSSWAA